MMEVAFQCRGLEDVVLARRRCRRALGTDCIARLCCDECGEEWTIALNEPWVCPQCSSETNHHKGRMLRGKAIRQKQHTLEM